LILLTTRERFNPLKIGLLIVALSYFLFALHDLFTLEWIGEWARGSTFNYVIYYEDISSSIGIIFRFIAGIIALSAVVFYFQKGLPSKAKFFKVARWVAVLEGIYWLGLIVNGYYSVVGLENRILLARPILGTLNYLALNTIPSLLEALILPISLFVSAYMLKPNKPARTIVRWGFIVSALYVFVFWLINTSIWVSTIFSAFNGKGVSYLIVHPQHLLSFGLTVFGLLALGVFITYHAIKVGAIRRLREIDLRSWGVILTAIGLFYLWNYLSWIFFGNPSFWSDWYAWLLGHNLDLWMLSLPMFGVALLLYDNALKQKPNNQ